MLNPQERKKIKRLMQREIIPAIGCTEPVAVSLCVAKATETLGRKPERIDVILSANVFKNAMGVGIPGTGMIGLPIAVALGSLIGKPEYGLEVLRDLQPADVECAKRYIQDKRIKIDVETEVEDRLYIEVRCYAGNESSVAVVRGSHTQFSYIGKNGADLLKKEMETYDILEKLDIPFQRVDHYPVATTEDCAEIEAVLGMEICKNLFLRNGSKTEFFLLVLPGGKKFVTRDVSRQIGSSRLSFGEADYMEEFLNVTPGSVSILGLMYDKVHKINFMAHRVKEFRRFTRCGIKEIGKMRKV